VANNSHTLKPLVYKISGVWGKITKARCCIWVLVLALLLPPWWAGPESAAASGSPVVRWAYRACWRPHSCCSFCLHPIPSFALIPAPFEGAGLNPLLQDPGLAMHPPMLYAGYVGLFRGIFLCRGGRCWWVKPVGARAARPFMLIAWIALTCGIALGSWWAYYVLGWGGFLGLGSGGRMPR